MAGKILTAEDFGGETTKTDTPSATIPADQKFDQDGKVITEEPEKVETPVEEERVEPQPKPSDFKPKHKTWEETEKARLELERGFTEKSMKLSDSERELERYRKPVETYKEPTIDDQITEIAENAIKEINAISVEYDTEGKPKPESLAKRDRDAAVVWAKANRKISRIEINETNREADSHKTVVSKLYKGATDGGLKSDDELEMLGSAFDRTDPKLDLDARITSAVENTKTRISRLREGFVRSQEKDKKEKEDLKVLGRGSTRRETKETKETQPSTMSQDLAELNEKRRMTRDDLR